MALMLAHSLVPSMTVTPLTPGGRAVAEKMPGVTAPFGLFDPLGCVEDTTKEQLDLYREAELTHGRVAMMAALGFLVQENFHPIFASPAVDGPVIRQLDQVLSFETGQLGGSVLL